MVFLLLASILQFCTGEQAAEQAINSITAYQCTADYAEMTSPPAISQRNSMLRVCIAGTHSAVDCQKVVEATITQQSKNTQEKLVVAGEQQAAFAKSVEITKNDKKCMLSVLLADKYFTKSSSTMPLQVVISGSVSLSAAIPSSNTTTGAAIQILAEPEEGPKVQFALSASLNPEGSSTEPEKSVSPKPDDSNIGPEQSIANENQDETSKTNEEQDTATTGSVTAYQCTSDYVEVIDPPVISSESRMLRVCIAGVASAVECEQVIDATITQGSKQISDRLVVHGHKQAVANDNIEVTAQGGKCMIAALLTHKYFIQKSSSDSLQAVMSGSVAVMAATASAGGRRHLRAKPSREGIKVSFEILAKLTYGNSRMLDRAEDYDHVQTQQQVVDGATTSVCGIVTGIVAFVMMLI